MEHVDGVVVVLYTHKNDHPRIAVLKRTLNWEGWELVKGRKEGDEDTISAARREIIEETGIEPESIEELDTKHEWTYERDGAQYKASYDSCLAKAPADARMTVDTNDEDEHTKGFFLNFRDAKDILTHKNQRELIEMVENRLKEKVMDR